MKFLRSAECGVRSVRAAVRAAGRACLLGGILAVATGCGGGKKTEQAGRDTLTERQKDSALAKSGIPGASAVGAAMRAADSMSARVQAADTIGN